MRPDGEERGGLRGSASYTALPCSEPPSNPPALGLGGRRGHTRRPRELAGAVGEGATPCTDGRPSENTPPWLGLHQSSLPNAAKGYPPREPREPTRIMWVNEKSSAQFVYVRLSEWLGWPQASPREPLRCHISSLVIVETLKDSFEDTQTRQTVLWSPVNHNSTLRDNISKGWVRA